MIEFNKISTESNFIKNLLISTYLPLIRTVRDMDYIIEGRIYVYKCNIIKCTDSGYIITGLPFANFTQERAGFKVIEEYHFGEKNGKLCTNYVSNCQGYDVVTHERLGKYLRSLRDMYGLNLMPLYNCFSGQTFYGHHIFDDKISQTEDYEDNLKVYRVPIRFNTDYTICMENIGITTFAPAFIRNNNLLLLNNNNFGNKTDVTNHYNKLYHSQTIKNFSNLRFTQPIKIRFDNIPITRDITYVSSLEPNQLDSRHDDRYYKRVSSRETDVVYYIRNNGEFTSAGEISEVEFNNDPIIYWYVDNGYYTQKNMQYQSGITYYTKKTNGKSTYEIINNPTDDDILYKSINPSTGSFAKSLYYQIVPLYTTALEDVEDAEGYLGIDDSGFNYYYIIKGGSITNAFHEWRDREGESCRTISSDTYNSSDIEYYYRSNNTYISCDGEPYDDHRVYWVKTEDGTYMEADEDYFYSNIDNIIVNWLTPKLTSLEGYYELNTETDTFIPCTSSSQFDINKTYATRIQDEDNTTPWEEYSGGQFIPTSDTYIDTSKDYFSKGKKEIENTYSYDITKENCAMYDYVEGNLYLLIQVPKSFDSNIVILEGDYTHLNSEKLYDEKLLEILPANMVDYIYTSSLKLMRVATKRIIPFSDTLMEFLLWNAISSLETINNNMDRMYSEISDLLGSPFTNKYANYWYSGYRKLSNEIGQYYNNRYIADNIGYITKDIEASIETSKDDGMYYDYVRDVD